MNHRLLTSFAVLAMMMAGCQSQGDPEPTPQPEPAEATEATVLEPSPEPAATETLAATDGASDDSEGEGALTFTPATYEDLTYGFAFEHPADWSQVGETERQSRGEIVQLGESETVRLSVAVLRWDPTADLDAYLAQRALAWDSSGMEVESEERSKVDGVDVARYVVRGIDGETGLFLFAALPERYLSLSGPDSALLQEVLDTLRFEGVEAGAAEGDSATAPAELDCRNPDTGSLDGVACNVIASLETRNTQPLMGYMSDPFGMLYWRSEGVSMTRENALTEIETARLPEDPTTPPVFSTDPATLPTMMDVPPSNWLGPDVELELTLFSTGWGPAGADEAMLFFTRDDKGEIKWSHLFYAMGGFEK